MPSDQTLSRISRSFPPWAVRIGGKLNVPLYRLSRGRMGGKLGRAPILLLTSTGRRSGRERTAPVLYMLDGEDLVVIGSNAGHAGAPAWSLNLKANPEARVEIAAERRLVRARLSEGEERERLWRAMNAQYEGFEDYRERTDREIAVFVLEPR
jgi:F420H(2)-dependent quinone reductase